MRPKVDLSVYLVTDTVLCGGIAGLIETVRRAALAGVTVVQLRDHHLSDEDFVAVGKQLVALLQPQGIPLLVDDRVHLVSCIGAQGAHIGQSDMPAAEARALLGRDAILGLTANNTAEIKLASQLPHDVIDYVGTGALHPTMTKDHIGAIGIEGVRAVIKVSPWPVCAIGGVTSADAQALRGIGCHGMSVVSAICGVADPEQATRRLVEAWRIAGEAS